MTNIEIDIGDGGRGGYPQQWYHYIYAGEDVPSYQFRTRHNINEMRGENGEDSTKIMIVKLELK